MFNECYRPIDPIGPLCQRRRRRWIQAGNAVRLRRPGMSTAQTGIVLRRRPLSLTVHWTNDTISRVPARTVHRIEIGG